MILGTLLLYIHIINAQFTPNLGTISCGQTVTGSLTVGSHVYYSVQLPPYYFTSIAFEGCNSNFDLDLMFYSGNELVKQCDACQEVGSAIGCGHTYANDLLIDDDFDSSCSYTLGIGGYSDNHGGQYNIQFICTQPEVSTDCTKHRREWSTLTNAEQLQYMTAFKTLADAGTIQQLSTLHNNAAAAGAIHYVPAFFPWHRLLILYLEHFVRQLGGEYACFSLPYWDWSNEPSPSDVTWFCEQPELLRTDSQMGGDPNGQCISTGIFRRGQYNPAHPSYSCLWRDIDYTTDASCQFHQPSSLMDSIDATNNYNSFRNDVEYAPHGNAHNCIGGEMSTNYSPDDPWFYLHHAFIDYIWSLWQDCNNYDGATSITTNMYNGNVNRQLWGFDITEGQMLDHATWGVSYEKGPFWDNANVDSQSNCGGASDPVNPDWFKDTTRRRLKKGGPRGKRRATKGDSHYKAQEIRKELKEQGYNGKELVKLWSIKVCEYEQEQNGNICKMPDSFDDCSNMELDPETNDIVITLEELLNKNGINECMKKTRERDYDWANMTHSLKALCDGCYDRFCDKSAMREKCANEYKGRQNKVADAPFVITFDLPNNDISSKNIKGSDNNDEIFNDHDGGSENDGFKYDDRAFDNNKESFNDYDGGSENDAFKYNEGRFEYNDRAFDNNEGRYAVNISQFNVVIIVGLLLILLIINIGICIHHKSKRKTYYHKISRASDTDAI